MGYGATSAPTIQTGNPQWDRNLGGLAHIFGTPGGYERGLAAGAQAREALLKGDQTISERNAAIALYNAQRGLDETGQPQMPPAPTYRPSGVVGGAPIMEQPPGLVSSSGAPTGPPLQPQPSQPGFLARIFGASTQPTPPASSPSPNAGAPSAPNTTASDGSVPANSAPPDRTFNTTGGGQHYAPAANPDGSPRQPPPLNLASIMGLAALSGQTPEMVKLTLGSLLAGGMEHGIIPRNTATSLAGLIGNNAPYESDQSTLRTRITDTGATTRTSMEQQGANYRTGLVEGGTQRRFEATPLTSQGVNPDTGQPTLQYPGQTPQGTPLFNQAVADQQNQGVLVYQRRPDGSIDYVSPPVTVTLRQAQQQNLPRFVEGQRGGQPPADSREAAARSDFVHTTFENAYTPGGSGTFDAEHNVAASPSLKSEAAVTDYAEFLRDQSHGTMTVQQAYTTAQQELQRQGFLPTKEQTDNARRTHVFVGPHPAQTVDNQGNPAGWTIPLLKHYVSPRGDGHVIEADTNQAGANISATNVDTSKLRPEKPTVPNMPAPVAPKPAARAAPQPPAAAKPPLGGGVSMGPAPPGWAEGTIHAGPGGQVVVMGGKVYSYP